MTNKSLMCFVAVAVCFGMSGCSEKLPDSANKANSKITVQEKAKGNNAEPVTATDKALKATPASKPAVKGVVSKGEPGAIPSSQPAADMPDSGHFGAKFTMTDSMPLKAVFDAGEKYVGKMVKVEGKVQSVCKKKGCWLVIETNEETSRKARITMKDYGFFAPKDCDGKAAVVEGSFSRKLVKEPMRKHLAEDGGKDPSKITGDVEEYTIVANGLEIKK